MSQAAARTDKILVVDDDARIRDLLRRFQTAAMEMIERRQLLGGRMVGVDALGRERGAQPFHEVAAGVVERNLLCVGRH